MLKMKAKAPAPAYVPTALFIPTADEAKNGHTRESLTKEMENLPPIERARERLVRARHAERLARKQIESFRREFNVRGESGTTLTALHRLEKILYEAEGQPSPGSVSAPQRPLLSSRS